MAAVIMECGDFLEFQDSLLKMRQIDDKIIYMLNTSIPTESFKSQVDPKSQCKDLYDEIEAGHAKRQQAISKCLNVTREKVKQLKSQKESGSETPLLLKDLRKEQSKLRMLESELGVEEIVRKRTIQVYYERCRGFYKPSNITS